MELLASHESAVVEDVDLVKAAVSHEQAASWTPTVKCLPGNRDKKVRRKSPTITYRGR